VGSSAYEGGGFARLRRGLPAVILVRHASGGLVRLLSGGLEGLPAIFLDGLTLILPGTASYAHARRY
jgi:hypothetical protein